MNILRLTAIFDMMAKKRIFIIFSHMINMKTLIEFTHEGARQR